MNRHEAELRLRQFFLSLIETCGTEDEAFDRLQAALMEDPELFELVRRLTGESELAPTFGVGLAEILFDDPAVVAKLEKLAERSSAWLN